MNKIEPILLQIMTSITRHNIPITFKGAMVLNNILDNSEYIRATQDIDGSTPVKQIDKIVEDINSALKDDGLEYYFEIYRYPSEIKSAGFYIYQNDGKPFSQMDLDNKECFTKVTYTTSQGDFVGCSIEQTLANKIYVLSTKKIFRRIKDFYDVYRIAKCLSFKINDIYDIQEKIGIPFEDFDCLINRIKDVNNAYTKFSGINSKPEFSEIYDYITRIFIVPFQNNSKDLLWDHNKQEWIKI